MHRVRALITGLLVGTLIIIGALSLAVSPVAAQESPSVGDTTSVENEEGTPVGSITVTEVVDPFVDFGPDYPAETGSRYVVASVAFDADAGGRFDIAPWTIVLQDDAGFLWNQASLVLPDDALVPELSGQTLAPGSRVTGLVGFVLPADRAPARILYQPESSRIVPLADLLGEPAPVAGDTVVLPDSEGGVGSVMVSDVIDPFEDIDPAQAPPEGSRFVLVTLVYENTSEGRFSIEPYGLLLRDGNGDLWTATSVSRPEETRIVPDLTSAQLAPGDRLSGAVVFAVPVEVALSGVYDSPVSGQLLQLADLGEGAEETASQPTTEDDDVATPEESASASSDGGCAELEQWLAATRGRIQQAADMSLEDATMEDPDGMAGHVEEYAALADAQLAESAPAEAVAANKALAATFNAYSSSIMQILAADDPDKDRALELTEGMNTFKAAGDRIHSIEGELARIESECGLT